MHRLLWLLASFVITSANQRCKPVAYSFRGSYLKGHVISSGNTAIIGECLVKCSREPRCRSINFRFEAELAGGAAAVTTITVAGASGVTATVAAAGVAAAVTASGVAASAAAAARVAVAAARVAYRSCAEIKGAHKESKSGNYMITVKDKMLQVFCDMDNHGGGWTLVASISSSNRNHLIEGEHNCFNSGICVPYEDMDSLPSRKIKDEDIRWMASAYHGAFRVDVLRPSSNYSVFYAIPRGGEHFNSACTGGKGGSCPRIIISHSYPYQWESNCKGIDKGYLTGDSCHRVFDGHDNRECGSMWFSSKYDTNRILYGYCQSNGIYRNLQGRLFVK
ncbi:uncharacterized protein LOC144629598 [Oculina patagonica]